MRMARRKVLAAGSVLTLLLTGVGLAAAQNLPSDFSGDYFETKVRPILATNCYSCHTNSALSGLRLDSLDSMKKGGKRGPAIIPGDPENSLMIQALKHSAADGLKMPMGGKLKDSEIDVLATWIKNGAVWSKTDAPVVAVADNKGAYVIPPERKNFWSFQALKNPQPPDVKDKTWAKNTIDRFVLSRLEKEGLKPVKPVGKRDLLRRAALDLTGLPPSYEEVAAFEKDSSPDAFAKVVDRLLASPHSPRWAAARPSRTCSRNQRS